MIKEEELGSNSYSFATTVHSSAPWRGPLFLVYIQAGYAAQSIENLTICWPKLV